MNSYEDRIKNLQSESQRFQRYLHGLPADAWSKQSACDLWQVDDVVAHLMGVAEFYAATVERGLKGESSPPEGRPAAGTGHPAISAGNTAEGAIANRKRLGSELLSTFEARDNHLNQLLARISPPDREKPCYHPGGIVPAGNFVDLRFKEVVLHEWDIRSSLEPEANLSPSSLPSIVILISQAFASGSLRWAFWPGPALPKPVRYRFDVTEPVPVSIDVVVEGDKFRSENSGNRPADVTFRCDTGTFALLMYGRLSPGSAIGDGRLAAEGNVELAGQFSQWFRGI